MSPLSPEDLEPRSPEIQGFISVGREPGGTIGQWQRTALLFRDERHDETFAQIHDARLRRWDEAGLQLLGVERRWRRKTCEEFQVAWQISFPRPTEVLVYLLRSRGARIASDLLRASSPIKGLLRAEPDTAWKTRGGCSAALSLSAGGHDASLQLHGVQMCSWDRRGIVLSGTECQGYGRRVEDFRQSWFVVFGARCGSGSTHVPRDGLTSASRHLEVV